MREGKNPNSENSGVKGLGALGCSPCSTEGFGLQVLLSVGI